MGTDVRQRYAQVTRHLKAQVHTYKVATNTSQETQSREEARLFEILRDRAEKDLRAVATPRAPKLLD